MSEKYNRLKKLMISHGIKYGVMLLGCLIAFGGVYYLYGSIDEEIQGLKSKDQRLKSEITQLQSRNDRLSNTLDLYNKLTDSTSLRNMELDRKNISRLLQKLSEKYRVSGVNIQIESLKERTKPPFVRETGTIITTDISLEFESISDLHAFAFLEDLISEFSGYLNLKSLTIKKNGNIDQNLLRSLIKDGRARLFDTAISFEWLGLKPKPTSKNKPKTEGGA